MGLDYDYPEKKKACSDGPLKVKYDGRAFGEIRKVKDGYQFFAKGDKAGGPVLVSVPEVQNSLINMQPSKADRKDEEEETTEDQSAGMIKKVKKELKQTNAKLDAAKDLLEACYGLFQKQSEDDNILNLLAETVMIGEIETDGHSVHEDITKFLEES